MTVTVEKGPGKENRDLGREKQIQMWDRRATGLRELAKSFAADCISHVLDIQCWGI